ncbi:CaiB/BaiF CoA transferase family protein [Roseibium aggregatum]|uniref:CoA transferase n=1 Tax=Roseibium aggregatum TaxID=187304 RepID=A0A939J205_9HYPH|nr:CoA transferase [Roseibium aggregatum]MBN9669027.1 CoA transferase [Roseibium aggregatum]
MSDSNQPETGRRGPLSGVRVLDFSRILSGPYASMVLADLGAEVIKVEPVGSGDETRNFPPFKGPLSHYYIALNRSKKSLALDLKSPRGNKIARDLAGHCDIVLENFRPGVMERLGLDYETLSADRPELIYCSITGFGDDSPLANKPAFDIVAQALSGIMSVNREPGAAPNKLGLPLGDMAGSIFSVFGILAALVERGRTGRGQKVDVAMLDGLIAMLGYLSQIFFVTGTAPQPIGTQHPSIVPYGSFKTRDGHVIVACLTERFWINFAECLGLSHLTKDPRFVLYQDRLANRDQLEPLISERMRQDTTAYWLDRLAEFDVPNAPILDVAEALQQEHVQKRGLVEKVSHPVVGEMDLVGNPIRFGNARQAPSTAPSLLGEDSYSVLKQYLDLEQEELQDLASEGIVQFGDRKMDGL